MKIKEFFETAVLWVTVAVLGAATAVLGVIAVIFPFVMVGVMIAIPAVVVLGVLRLFGLV